MKIADRPVDGTGGRRQARGSNGRPGTPPTLNEVLDLAAQRRAARDALLRAGQEGDRPALQQLWQLYGLRLPLVEARLGFRPEGPPRVDRAGDGPPA